jgi:hypothetical protein
LFKNKNMGNYSSQTENVSVCNDEQTLTVSPSQLAAVCGLLSRAQVEVVATSVPHLTKDRTMIWLKQSENLRALIAAGALGDDVETTPYISKGTKVTSLEQHTTVIGMQAYCAKMVAEGIDVVGCSAMTNLGNKKIYHN